MDGLRVYFGAYVASDGEGWILQEMVEYGVQVSQKVFDVILRALTFNFLLYAPSAQ